MSGLRDPSVSWLLSLSSSAPCLNSSLFPSLASHTQRQRGRWRCREEGGEEKHKGLGAVGLPWGEWGWGGRCGVTGGQRGATRVVEGWGWGETWEAESQNRSWRRKTRSDGGKGGLRVREHNTRRLIAAEIFSFLFFLNFEGGMAADLF